MIPGKEAYDLDKVRTNEGLAPFNGNHETPHPRKLVRETAKILKRGHRIYEVPISYDGREFDEGKKINWRDALVVIAALIRYRFTE